MKSKTSRADFKRTRVDNSAAVNKAAKSSNGKHKWTTIENEFLPSLRGEELAGATVEGKIVAIEDWKHGGMAGTSLTLDNDGFQYKVPLYGSISYRLAKHQGAKELNRKKAIGLLIRLTHVGTKPGKGGKDMQLFDVAVAK
jgi:hypothetical protein